MRIEFTVPGQPVAKGRARACKRGNFIAHYTPEKTASYENLVKLYAQKEMGTNPITELPVSMDIEIYLEIPKSFSKKKQIDAQEKRLLPTKKPDCSNVLKSIEDAMNGIVYKDDSQIVVVRISKYYSIRPRAVVRVIDQQELI